MLASTIVPVRSRWPRDARCALISSNRPSPRPCFSNRCRKFRMVVLVGQRLRQPQPHETPHRLHLVEKVLHPRVAQVVEQLHAVNTQHHRQRVRAPTAPRLRIERLDPSLQPLPGNQPCPSSQETTHAASRRFFKSCSSSAKLACAMARSSNPRLLRKLWHTRLDQTFPNRNRKAGFLPRAPASPRAQRVLDESRERDPVPCRPSLGRAQNPIVQIEGGLSSQSLPAPWRMAEPYHWETHAESRWAAGPQPRLLEL